MKSANAILAQENEEIGDEGYHHIACAAREGEHTLACHVCNNDTHEIKHGVD